MSNLCSFRSIVGYSNPSSVSTTDGEMQSITDTGITDASTSQNLFSLSSNRALPSGQVDLFIPTYICEDNLCTNSLPSVCPDICDSIRDGMYVYMTQRTDVESTTPPVGFTSWSHYFFDRHDLKANQIPDITSSLFNYFEVWAATNTPRTKFLRSATVALDFCEAFDIKTAKATIVITDSGGIVNGETFTLIDSAGVTTVYTIYGGVAPASGGGNGGAATVGFRGVGGGAAGKIAAASAIAQAINATTDANYTAVSDGVDTVVICL